MAPANPPSGYTATTPVPHGPVTVNAGDQYLDADFGYDSPDLARLGGTVWDDLGVDGLLDAGEPGIPGVSVDLIRDNGNGVWDAGEPIIATTTTDQAGNYDFEGLPAGSYLVVVSDTQNVLDDFVGTLPGPNQGQDGNNQNQPYPVALPDRRQQHHRGLRLRAVRHGGSPGRDRQPGVVRVGRQRDLQPGEWRHRDCRRDRGPLPQRRALRHDHHRRQRRLRLHQPAGGQLLGPGERQLRRARRPDADRAGPEPGPGQQQPGPAVRHLAGRAPAST